MTNPPTGLTLIFWRMFQFHFFFLLCDSLHSQVQQHLPSPTKLFKISPDQAFFLSFFSFSHPYSFHFDASVWWRPSVTTFTFPIRLAQCGSRLLISHNATATVVASVLLGLPLSPATAGPPLLPPPPLASSPFIFVSDVLQYDTQRVAAWTAASSHMLRWLVPSLEMQIGKNCMIFVNCLWSGKSWIFFFLIA